MSARIVRRPDRLVAILVLAGFQTFGPPLCAQSVGLQAERDLPPWLSTWSVLTRRGDLPRRLPSAGGSIPLLQLPLPIVGLFWTAGNPAGLAAEVERSRTDFVFARAAAKGTFRRPLDPAATEMTQVSVTSWQRIDRRLTMLGRAVVGQERLDPGTQADETEPFPTSPFVTTDTGTTPSRRTRARLEGVAGWSLGQWAVGLNLGYDARENETIEAGFVRRSRQAMPGAAVGVARRFGGIRVGLVGRLRNRAETILLTERAAEGQVWQLEGYREVAPINVSQSYYRRIEEAVPSLGLGLSGSMDAGRWALFAEHAALRERRTRQQQNNPALDRWNTTSWTLGASFQRPWGRWLITGETALTLLTGDGDLALDSTGTVFTARERSGRVRLEARLAAGGPWLAVASASLHYERRTRTDLTLGVSSDIRATAPAVALEVGRSLAGPLRLVVTGAVLRSLATASLPDPDVRGPLFRRLVAPELDLEARGATSIVVGAMLQWEVRSQMTLWVSARRERLSPTDPSVTGLGAGGHRAANGILAGLQLR